jgi:hypothetical protein
MESVLAPVTDTVRFLHRQRRERLARINAAAVRDDGIDLKRKPAAPEPKPEQVVMVPEVVPMPAPAEPALPFMMPEIDGAKRPSIRYVLDRVAKYFNLRPLDIIAPRRTANVVRPRQIVMFFAKICTPRSFPEIGRRLGGRDHTTILHGVRVIEKLRGTDTAVAAAVNDIAASIVEDGFEVDLAAMSCRRTPCAAGSAWSEQEKDAVFAAFARTRNSDDAAAFVNATCGGNRSVGACRDKYNSMRAALRKQRHDAATANQSPLGQQVA